MGISPVFSRLTDKKLKKAVNEIFNWHKTCILEEGVTRELDKILREKYSVEETSSLRLAESSVFKEAAKRFCDTVKD